MWRNYLIVGYRALTRSKTYAFINILGLALGLAACLMILLYVRHETSYDSWLPDSERIFQVQATWHEPGQPVTRNQASPLPVRDTIGSGFPQIEAVTIVMPGRLNVIRDGQPAFIDEVYVDPGFFDIFQLPFVHGSAKTALASSNALVLTEREALRQFGTTDVLGRTLTEKTSEGSYDYRITGVVRDLPKNSHMTLSAVARYDPGMWDDVPPAYKSWGTMGQYHYVKLRAGADVDEINRGLAAWEKKVIPTETVEGRTASRADIMDLKLVNVADIHLGEAQLSAVTPGNDARTVATFSVVALLILAMACINFVNLSTARAGQRAREVALRKVLGASRRQLVVQFLGESLLLAGVALVLALTLVELTAPWFSSWLDMELSVSYLGQEGFLLPALLLLGGVGAVGGLYPAFYLSRYQPAQVLRANKSSADPAGSGRLRNLLVVTQFAIAIGLIISTAVIYSQTWFVESFDPGFERDGLIQVTGARALVESGNYEAFRNEALRVPGVAGVARTNLGIAAATSKSIILARRQESPTPIDIGFYRVDPQFFPTLGTRLLAGRLLDERHARDMVVPEEPGSDAAAAAMRTRGLNVVINRRAAMQLGFTEPAAAVGQHVGVGIDGADSLVPTTVVGVVEDTRIRTARDAIEPLIFGYDPARASFLVVRYRGAVPSQVRQGLKRVWAKFNPDLPFEADFAEDLVARATAQERARASIFLGFAIFSVLISCLGLFGLAAFTTERRTKEIGIRKVLGAKIRDIVRLLTWQFSKPVVVANLVAWPAAWWAMRDWLNSFDLRIPLTPGPFVFAAALALAIAIGTVAGHAIRVARMNPIHALRYE
jgi:putative ABC transport system permease protein